MGKGAMAAAMTLIVAVALLGCGSGSTSGSTPHGASSAGASTSGDQGVGQGAPIGKIKVAQRARVVKRLIPGSESNSASGCVGVDGPQAEIGLFTDVPVPSCVKITPKQRLLVVNRSGAYRRSEGHASIVRLGGFSARLAPQQAALFEPVGRFLGRGLHLVIENGGSRGAVLVLPGAVTSRCPSSDLVVWTGAGHSAVGAGTVYSELTITNLSGHACSISGVPAVVAVDGGGRQIDRAESVPGLKPDSGNRKRRVTLRTGGSASFEVTHYDGIGAGRCRFTLTYGLRVKLPGARNARTIPDPLGYCPLPSAGLGLRVGRIE